MEEKKYIATIVYQNKKYAIFTNHFHKKCFLEVDEKGILKPPTSEVYQKLDIIYNHPNLFQELPLFEKSKFSPQVIFTSENKKRVLMLASSIVLGSTIGLTIGHEVNRSVKTMDITNLSQEQVISYYQDYGIELAQLKDGTYYVKSVDRIFGNDLILAYSNDEIRDYLEVPYPTFEQVEEAIKNNNQLSMEEKTFIQDYITEVQKKNDKTDWAVFYYNMQHLMVDKISLERIQKDALNRVGYFDPQTCRMALPDNWSDEVSYAYIFRHELSHMFNTTMIPLSTGKSIYRRDDLVIPEIEDGQAKMDLLTLGAGVAEGINDLYTYQYSGKGNYDPNFTSYFEIDDMVDLWTDYVLDTDVETLKNEGMPYLIDALYEKGIENATDIIEAADVFIQSNQNQEVYLSSNMREDIYEEVVGQLVEKWIKEELPSNRIYQNLFDFLEHSFIEEIHPSESTEINQQHIKYQSFYTVSDALKKAGKEAIDQNDYDWAEAYYKSVQCFEVDPDLPLSEVKLSYMYATPSDRGISLRYTYAMLQDGKIVVHNPDTGEMINLHESDLVGTYEANFIKKEEMGQNISTDKELKDTITIRAMEHLFQEADNKMNSIKQK